MRAGLKLLSPVARCDANFAANGMDTLLHRLPAAFSKDNPAVQCCGKKYIFGYKKAIYQELYFAISLGIEF